MKKIAVILLAAVLLLSLCACAAAPAEKPGTEESSAGIANPMREIKAEEVNIPMNLPEGAKDVRYFFFDVSSDPFYETRFTLNGKSAFTRAKASSETAPVDFSGLSYTFETADAEVDGKPAKVYTCKDCGFAAWVDVAPGVAYIAGYTVAASAEEILELANACAKPLQGNAG